MNTADLRRQLAEAHAALEAATAALEREREGGIRYRELMEVVDKGILVRDADGRITYANPAAIRILDLDPGESLDSAMRADRWRIFDEHGDQLPYEALPSFRALRSGVIEPSSVLGLLNIPTNRLTWLSITSVPQFAPGDDRPHQVLSLFSDVTAFKRDITLFDRVQELAHIGGWEWDATNELVYLTNEAQRMLGLGRAMASFDELQACLRDNERKRFHDALIRAVDHGDAFELELQGIGPDGHTLWIRIIGEGDPDDPTGMRLCGTVQDITDTKQAEETLRVQARTDPLTMLLNRDAVLEELQARLADPAQAGVAVLYIDLDRFKVVNDVLGHAAGDQVLVHAARRIQGAVDTEGLIARVGGDEFVVVCATYDDEARPQRLADQILAAFRESFRMAGEEFTITASIGIARAPEHGDRPQLLIQNADVAMYDSKRRSRNGWQDFSPTLAERQQQRLQMETHLRRAVDNREFKLVYQPQVDLATGRTIGAEALIRWRNDTLGEMRPDHFIGHAENTGDIVRIGTWVLREACQQMRRWRDQGLAIERMAVNVSYRQFLAEDLADTVSQALASAGLPGDALELEFTERVLIEDAPDTLTTFAGLRMLGVVLSIDDFGEGYSALNYLRRLPIHGLKLSGEFVRGVPQNGSDVAICQAVAGIAQSLGLGMVAEGVENEAQRQFLLRLGVGVGQGFLFAPGLTPEEFALRMTRPQETLHA